MRHGLWLYPADDPALCERVSTLLLAQDIPLAGFTNEPSRLFIGTEDRTAFLFRLSQAVFLGHSIPASLVLRHLSSDATPGNVLRRCLEWQENLLPYLHTVDTPVPGNGFFRLGNDLLICPLNDLGASDAQLPDGSWTDIVTGEVFTGRIRCLRSPNAMPILAREGAVIPTGNASFPTLHWYQAPEHALGLMHPEPYHLILHRDGVESYLR